MKQVSTKLCQSLHTLPVASVPSDSSSKERRTPAGGNVFLLTVFLLLLFFFFTVFGTLAAEFEVLVFACQNGDQNPNVLLNFCCDFQVTSKYLYGLGNHKKRGSNILIWEGRESFHSVLQS